MKFNLLTNYGPKHIMAEICGSPFPFGARIASDEHEIRLKAIDEVFEWLKNQKKFDIDDGKKLWYVLLNGLWKTGGWKNQHALAKKLSSILQEDFPEDSNIQKETIISSFFLCFGKEWGSLDKWRIEKFLVLVRQFVNAIIEWTKNNNKLDYLPSLFREVLALDNCVGLQQQFVDVITDPLHDLMKLDLKMYKEKENSTLKEPADFLKPFSALFADSHSKPALVIRINDQIIDPLVSSDGETLFGNDIDAILHFMRGLISKLNTSLKQNETNAKVSQIRYDTAARVRQLIADILKAREEAGAPPEKSTD